MSEPVFFDGPEELRAWLEENHESAGELWVGIWKKASGRRNLTWSEIVDQVLCFGWIDGKAKTIDEHSYMQRITPRRKGSNWSEVNISKVAELTEAGLMRPAGTAAFEARKGEPRERRELSPEFVGRLRSTAAAWEDWEARPPGYRRLVADWVMSAKREETRERRLAKLIECSAEGRKVPPLDDGRIARRPAGSPSRPPDPSK